MCHWGLVAGLNELLSAEMLKTDIFAERARRRRAEAGSPLANRHVGDINLQLDSMMPVTICDRPYSDAALDAAISEIVARRLASIERGEPVPLDAAEVDMGAVLELVREWQSCAEV